MIDIALLSRRRPSRHNAPIRSSRGPDDRHDESTDGPYRYKTRLAEVSALIFSLDVVFKKQLSGEIKTKPAKQHIFGALPFVPLNIFEPAVHSLYSATSVLVKYGSA